VNQPCVLVVSGAFNASSWPQMLEELKRNPGKYNYASLGNGTNAHLSMELIANRSGTQIVQVPYPGSSQAVAAIVAGDVQMGCMPAVSVMSLVKAGRLKAIGVASRARTNLLPGMPTLAEQGLTGFEANSWIGVVAPAQTPAPILARLNAEITSILRQPDVAEALNAQLMEPVGNTPEQFTAYMKEELGRWGPIIRQNRITLD
jgi:tripartite-type tricarboxylate transporter receptor subunit TctC